MKCCWSHVPKPNKKNVQPLTEFYILKQGSFNIYVSAAPGLPSELSALANSHGPTDLLQIYIQQA